ncbi:MAG: CDP-alcohol phosphatidyltransferase family protein [Alphaproteobacteria bacterium]
MFDSKPFFQRRLRPAARTFARAGVTANQVTGATIALSCAGGAVILAYPGALWPLWLVPAVLLVRLAFNHIDGMLAREHGMKTPLGGMLNELADVVADAALYLPLATVPGVPAAPLVAVVMLGVVVETAGLAALAIAAERRNDGPLAKKPRGLAFGSIALALALGVAPGPWIDATLAALAVLAFVTVVRRVHAAIAEASRPCSTR